jgi:nitrogen fixation/metabolism regulation signal transduction histidine kinase
MRLTLRLALLMVLLTLLPSVPAALLTRQLIERSLNLGLSDEVDGALEAGIRQARQNFQGDRSDLEAALERWVIDHAGDEQPLALAAAWQEDPPAGLLAEARVLFLRPDGSQDVWQTGPTLPEPDTSAIRGPQGSPTHATVARELADGGRLEARLQTDPSWREDAESLAATLQVLRSLQTDRQELESGFWMPFLSIYILTLLLALIVAAWLGRGIVRPVGRLLTATLAVSRGQRDVSVPVESRDEIGRLSEQFNDMVRTLDVQSRQLVDLEKMAGWREMARALAHEVKNPLTPIQLTVGEIREQYRGEDEQYRKLLHECTRIVIEEVESLRQVVSRFREFSRPVDPHFVPTDVNALLADVAALQRDLIIEKDLDPNLGSCTLDPDRLRQVLMNLASNARKAMEGCPEPRLRLASRPAGDRIVLVVEDSGPGIPAEDRQRFFEPYRSGTAGGLGLGLALVKGIVLAHHGNIEIEEGTWGGARFRIELPRQPEVDHE